MARTKARVVASRPLGLGLGIARTRARVSARL